MRRGLPVRLVQQGQRAQVIPVRLDPPGRKVPQVLQARPVLPDLKVLRVTKDHRV